MSHLKESIDVPAGCLTFFTSNLISSNPPTLSSNLEYSFWTSDLITSNYIPIRFQIGIYHEELSCRGDCAILEGYRLVVGVVGTQTKVCKKVMIMEGITCAPIIHL